MRVTALHLALMVTALVGMRAEHADAQYRGFDPRVERDRGFDLRRSPEARPRGPVGGDGRYGFGGGPREVPPYARDPRSYGYPPYGGAPAWRRGQFLPPDYRGASVANPARYHLRAPPAGYGWVGDGRNAYLMQRSTGMVLDLVPRAYERPGAVHPRR